MHVRSAQAPPFETIRVAPLTPHIVGLSRREREGVLSMLHRHIAALPHLHYRVRWEPDSLVFWDNRCVEHYAVWDYFPHTRIGERVSILWAVRPVA